MDDLLMGVIMFNHENKRKTLVGATEQSVRMILLKLLLVPLLIGLVSLAGRRWGAGIAGLLVGLPWTSGPVLFFLAVEHGVGFAAEAATGIIGGVLALTAFCFSYAWCAKWAPWYACVLIATAPYLQATVVLLEARPQLPLLFALVALLLALASMAMPRSVTTTSPSRSTRWEIPLRMLTATGIVLVLTGAAGLLGPRLVGLLAPFPVYASVLTVFAHQNQGAGAAIDTLAGVLHGTFSFAVFFLLAAVGLESVGIGLSFAAAAVSAASLHLILIHARRTSTRGQVQTEIG